MKVLQPVSNALNQVSVNPKRDKRRLDRKINEENTCEAPRPKLPLMLTDPNSLYRRLYNRSL